MILRSPGSPPSPGISVLALLILLVPAGLGLRHASPPDPAPASSPPDFFSSERAMAHIRRIAQKTHPTGSEEIAAVRGYLTGVLQDLDLAPEIQTATVLRGPTRQGNLLVGATVHNVVARMKGRGGSHPVLFLTHYDSVPTGPGAGDAGSAVATLLETARALRAGARLRNDLIFLFTDAEELGLLGAHAFLEEHPWGRTAAAVLNFEARGTCGPSMMFETGEGNASLIRAFSAAAPGPIASSLMYDFYKRLPNDTDFSVFRRAGFPGLNLAFTGCWEHYHTQEDSIPNVDARSLQHQGEYALSLARHLGNALGPFTAGHDRVFFSLPGGVVHYAAGWVFPLALFSLLAWITVLLSGRKRRRLHIGWTLAGLAGWLVATAAAAALSHYAWLAIKNTALVNLLPYGMAYNSRTYAAGFALLSVLVLLLVQIPVRRKAGDENLAMGALSWLLLLTLSSSVFVPGGSYVFGWPLLAGLAALGFDLARRDRPLLLHTTLAWVLPATAAGFLLIPIIRILNFTLSTQGLIPTALFISALAAALLPLINIAAGDRRWLAPVAVGLAALTLLMAGASQSGYDERRPRADSLFYALSADSGQAHWVSLDPGPDPWTSGFLGENPEKANLDEYLPFDVPVLRSPAPAASVQPARIATLEDNISGSSRGVRLRIHSPRRARAILVRDLDGVLLSASVDGKGAQRPPKGESEKGLSLYFVGVPDRGIVLDLSMPAGRPLTLEIVEQFDGLPVFPALPARTRPAGLMPSPAAVFDSSTLVRSAFSLPAAGPGGN